LTEADRRNWYADRLHDLSERNAAVPVVIGEELSRKLAAHRAEIAEQHPFFREAAE
jgi:hypothetical protein